jgi:hypothetical protein
MIQVLLPYNSCISTESGMKSPFVETLYFIRWKIILWELLAWAQVLLRVGQRSLIPGNCDVTSNIRRGQRTNSGEPAGIVTLCGHFLNNKMRGGEVHA